jgi:hypothetical protein
MQKVDARKQSREVLRERRKQVIRMHRKGVGAESGAGLPSCISPRMATMGASGPGLPSCISPSADTMN